MFDIKYIYKVILMVAFSSLVIACSDNNSRSNENKGTVFLDVYKGRKCLCCSKWIDIVRSRGIETQSHSESHSELYRIKDKFSVPKNMRSCHTSVSDDNYIFEGHIPAKFIQQFLKQPPENAFGLAVPAMPIGSPGMELGEKFVPYKIFQLNNDGSISVYAEVKTSGEQY